MNQPCYNSIALARHQHEIDRQEAKEHWIAAAVDRLMDDADFMFDAETAWMFAIPSDKNDFDGFVFAVAYQNASLQYSQHLSALEQARIDGQDGL